MAKWIQKIKTLKAHKGYCTPESKATCTPRRKALAHTFRAMARKRRKAEGGSVPDFLYDARKQAIINKIGKKAYLKKYPFGGAINKGVQSIATALGAKPENAQLWGSALSTLTGFIPGMQDNLLQGADLIGDIGTATGQEELQQFGEFTRPVANIAGMFTGDTGNILGKVPWKAQYGGNTPNNNFSSFQQNVRKNFQKRYGYLPEGKISGIIDIPGVKEKVMPFLKTIGGAALSFIPGGASVGIPMALSGGSSLFNSQYKHGGDPRYAQFHNLSQEEYNKVTINVEKDELEVKGGKVLTDYKAKPRHPEDENEVDFYGNTLAKPGNIIIPREKREAYLKGDKITRNTIETQLQRDQNKREKGELSELRSRNQYLKSLSENVRRHISATGKSPVEGTSSSVFPPGYSVGLKDLDLYRHGGGVNNLNAEDYSNLFYGQGGCVGCGFRDGGSVLPDFLYQARGKAMRNANPGYFKHGSKIRYQDESTIGETPLDYYGKSQAGYNVPQYSPAVSTAQTKFDPFYNPGTANFGINKPVQTQDNRFGFSDFAQYAAPLYNIGMGLFGKTPEVENIQNPYTERVKDIMSRRRINMSPVYEGISTASAGATRQLRGYTGGSAGLQLQGMQNIQNIEARNRANAAMQEQITNMGFRGEEASTLNVLGQQDVQGRERQRQLQLAMEAYQAQFIPKGLEQLGTYPQQQSGDGLLKKLLKEKGITI